MILDPNELSVATKAVRRWIDGTGAGYMVNDIQCTQLAHAVVEAIEGYKKFPSTPSHPPPLATPPHVPAPASTPAPPEAPQLHEVFPAPTT